jgi:Nucleoside diphosphate kinase
VQRGIIGEVIKRFEQKGFRLVALKMTQVTVSLRLFMSRCEWQKDLQLAAGRGRRHTCSILFRVRRRGGSQPCDGSSLMTKSMLAYWSLKSTFLLCRPSMPRSTIAT